MWAWRRVDNLRTDALLEMLVREERNIEDVLLEPDDEPEGGESDDDGLPSAHQWISREFVGKAPEKDTYVELLGFMSFPLDLPGWGVAFAHDAAKEDR